MTLNIWKIFILLAIGVATTTAASTKLFHSGGKVGTQLPDVTNYLFLVHPSKWKDTEELFRDPEVLKTISGYTVPPQKHGVFILRSQYLGIIGWTMRVHYNRADEVTKLWTKELPAEIQLGGKVMAIPIRREDVLRQDDPNKERPTVTRRQEIKVRRRSIAWVDLDLKPPALPGSTLTLERLHNHQSSIAFKIQDIFKRRHKPTKKSHYTGTVYSSPLGLMKRSPMDFGAIQMPEVEEVTIDVRDVATRRIAQPPGTEFASMRRNTFWRYKNSGKGVVVYVMDTGCLEEHPDLKDVNFQDWIYPGAFPPIKKTDVLLEENDTVHGTSIIGRIAGRVSGIAPEAEIVVVRTTSVPEGGYGYVDYLDALIKIYDHIKAYNSESSGIVINFAVNPSFSSLTADYMTQLHRFSEEVVRRIHDLDNVIIAAAAGNQKPEIPIEIEALPESHGGTLPKLVVVGGTSSFSGNNHFQVADYMQVWAPVTDMILANKNAETGKLENTYIQDGGGTSLGSATVSGAIAMWMSAGIPTDKIVLYMYSIAYPRDKTGKGPPILWTGIKAEDWPAGHGDPPAKTKKKKKKSLWYSNCLCWKSDD